LIRVSLRGVVVLDKPTWCFRVIVVSDRIAENPKEDVSGEVARSYLERRGYCVGEKIIVRNNYREILKAIRETNDRVLVLIGGTGLSPRDITVDIVKSTAWRCIPGFGEFFRSMSAQSIGYRAILSRADLCVLYDGRVVAALPGTPQSVELGLSILVDFIDHLIEEIDRFEGLHRREV